MTIKNIIFDFGGVLIDWNPRYLYRNVFPNETEMEIFLKNICTTEWNTLQDAGRPFEIAVKELSALHPEYQREIKLFYTGWPEMVGGEIHKNVSQIYNLKDKYRLFGLTNWSAETFPVVFNKYPFFKELEGIVVSGEEKLVKPDCKIYEKLLTRYNLNAKECLFIDDNDANIQTAKSLGFYTIHLVENTDLEAEMKRLELL